MYQLSPFGLRQGLELILFEVSQHRLKAEYTGVIAVGSQFVLMELQLVFQLPGGFEEFMEQRSPLIIGVIYPVDLFQVIHISIHPHLFFNRQRLTQSPDLALRSDEKQSELQSLMRI